MKLAWTGLLLLGCTNEDVLVARQLPAAVRADAAQVATSNNQFAIDVYHQLPAGNAIFSPFSISTAFAMLDAGANGQTDTELRTALHFTLPGDQLHTAYGALLHSLDTGRSYGTYTLATADRLFGQQGFAFEQPYLDTTKTDYGAELMPLDFVGDPDGSRGQINQWVSDETDGDIPMLFPPGSVDPSTRLALANAILFKGSWDHQFDASKTAPIGFHVSGGADITAPMMHVNMPLGWTSIPGGRVGVLPFQGKDLAMVIVLPDDRDGLATLESQLDATQLAQAIAQATPGSESVDVSLPKWKFHIGTGLDPIMQALGVTSVFDPTQADLSGIDGARDLFVQTAIHDAMIEVDEQGATAAAATGIGVGTAGEPEGFNADHSFVYLIYDNVTGSILFMGRVSDPTT